MEADRLRIKQANIFFVEQAIQDFPRREIEQFSVFDGCSKVAGT